jgi:hypothetical protein
MRKDRTLRLGLIAFVTTLAVSCTAGPPQPTDTPSPTAESVAATEQPSANPADTESPAAPEQAGEGKPDSAKATPRKGLQATNPITVELAAGKPTLVEFFAYW